jgi:hypothetical protein
MVAHLATNMVALDRLSLDIIALEARLAQSEKRNATLAESNEQRLEILHERVKALVDLQEAANPQALAGATETDWYKRASNNSRFPIRDRTAYVIGLFGTGRQIYQ